MHSFYFYLLIFFFQFNCNVWMKVMNQDNFGLNCFIAYYPLSHLLSLFFPPRFISLRSYVLLYLKPKFFLPTVTVNRCFNIFIVENALKLFSGVIRTQVLTTWTKSFHFQTILLKSCIKVELQQLALSWWKDFLLARIRCWKWIVVVVALKI